MEDEQNDLREVVYNLYKGWYTIEQLDCMTILEIQELIDLHSDNNG
jgi:hypothetical protein